MKITGGVLRLCVVVFLLATTVANAQERIEMSLQQIQEYAFKNSVTNRNATYDAEAAKYNTESLKAIGLPQIEGSVQFNNYIYAPFSIIPAGTFGPTDFRVRFGNPYTLTVGATASQLLFDGTWLVALEASRSYEKFIDQQVKKTSVDVKSSVTNSYYLALISAENVALLKDSKEQLVNTLNQTTALYEAGFTEVENVDQLQLAVNDLNIQISYAEQQSKLALDLLKFQIGMPLTTDLVLTDKLQAFVEAGAADLMGTTFLPENTLDVQLAASGIQLQQLNLKSKKAAYLPSVGAFINFQTAAYRQEFNLFDTSLPFFYGNLWGINMSVPILSGGRRKYEVKKVEVELKRVQDMEVMARQGVELEYRSSRSELQNALEALQASESSLKLAQSILQKTQIKFNEGLGTSFDITQKNTQLLTAQGQYIQAMMKALTARTRMAKSLNQL
jgi:outer membrane protein